MHLPNGSQIFVEASRDDSEVTSTNITNAKTPVVTATSDFAAGDILLVTNSDWSKLTNRVVRVAASPTPSGTSFGIEGVDVSDTNQFPAGGNATFVKITGWTEIPCVQDLGQDGGEQQFYTYQCLADDQEQQLPTFKSATSLTYTFADDYTNPIYDLLRKYDESGDVVALRMYVPRAKEMRCYSGVLSFNEVPNTTVNEMETVSLSVSLKGKFTRLPATTAEA